MRAAAPSAVATSASMVRTLGMPARALFSFALLRPGTVTVTPSAVRDLTMARPMPAEPPVTIAVLFFRCRSMRLLIIAAVFGCLRGEEVSAIEVWLWDCEDHARFAWRFLPGLFYVGEWHD